MALAGIMMAVLCFRWWYGKSEGNDEVGRELASCCEIEEDFVGQLKMADAHESQEWSLK